MGYDRVKDIISLMSPFTGTALVVLLVTAFVEFLIYYNKDRIKAKKALLICIIGAIIMLVLALFGVYLTEPTVNVEPENPDPPTEPPVIEEENNFLKFENGEYTK